MRPISCLAGPLLYSLLFGGVLWAYGLPLAWAVAVPLAVLLLVTAILIGRGV